MKKLSILAAILTSLAACSKSADYSYLNTDRRPMVIRISERYTDPPMIKDNGTWQPFKVVNDTLNRNTRASDYLGIKPDTLISSCSIDKIDSSFRIEIRKYVIN